MSYAIMRFAKIKAGIVVACQKHNERENKNYSNEDVNLELSHNNYHLVDCKNYKSSINKQIKERYLSMRNIRKDAVVGVETIFTSDSEFFKKLSKEDERIYFEKSLQFLKDFVGEKNVISAIVHKDEKTPHMHCIFTPIDDEGKLRYKSFINGRNDLIRLQNSYHKYISQYFELKRGKSAKETGRVHLSVADYKLETALQERELELKKVSKNTEEIKSKNKDLEYLKENLKVENEKFLKIKDIEKNVRKKEPNMFNKEYTVTMPKAEYNSLMTYAVKGEEFKNKLDKTLTEKDKEISRLKERIKFLERDNEEVSRELIDKTKEVRSLSSELHNYRYAEILDKTPKINEKYIEKLETIVPKETAKKLKEQATLEVTYNVNDKGNEWER